MASEGETDQNYISDLFYPETELRETYPTLSVDKIREDQLELASQICPESFTALELKNKASNCPKKISSTLPSLDECLRGGIPNGSITEFVGKATMGKSQFCFMIGILAAAPIELGGNGVSVLYFDTEKKFKVDRLEQLIDSRWGSSGWDLDELKNQILNRILIVCPDTIEQLNARIDDLEETINEYNVKLVIIDSIAAILRAEFGHDEVPARQEEITKQASQLKYIATKFEIPVVVTNQVTSSHGDDVAYHEVFPAMGTKWSHCVNTRLSLESTQDQSKVVNVWKSSVCPNVILKYIITESGVEGRQ